MCCFPTLALATVLCSPLVVAPSTFSADALDDNDAASIGFELSPVYGRMAVLGPNGNISDTGLIKADGSYGPTFFDVQRQWRLCST